jgi:hypothetical protein
MTALLLEKAVRLPILHKLTLIHDNNLVEIKDSVELVGDSDDGMRCESGTEQSLDNGFRIIIKARQINTLEIEFNCCTEVNQCVDCIKHLLARSFVQDQHPTRLPAQQRSRETEKLTLPVAEMKLFNLHVERMRVFTLIAFRDNQLPEVHLDQSLYDRFVVALFRWIGIQTHGSWEQIGILRETDQMRAHVLTRDAVEG